MNRLSDIARLPVSTFVAVTINVMLAIFATYYVHSRYWELPYLVLWIVLVAATEFIPIVVARLVLLHQASYYPVLDEMVFFRDIHKLADWVYVMAVSYAAFWVVVAWSAFTYRNTTKMLLLLLGSVGACTLFLLCPRFAKSICKRHRSWDVRKQ